MAEHPSGQAGKHVAQVHHESHGHSVAAWTAVTVILVGALVMSLAVVVASVPGSSSAASWSSWGSWRASSWPWPATGRTRAPGERSRPPASAERSGRP